MHHLPFFECFSKLFVIGSFFFSSQTSSTFSSNLSPESSTVDHPSDITSTQKTDDSLSFLESSKTQEIDHLPLNEMRKDIDFGTDTDDSMDNLRKLYQTNSENEVISESNFSGKNLEISVEGNKKRITDETFEQETSVSQTPSKIQRKTLEQVDKAKKEKDKKDIDQLSPGAFERSRSEISKDEMILEAKRSPVSREQVDNVKTEEGEMNIRSLNPGVVEKSKTQKSKDEVILETKRSPLFGDTDKDKNISTEKSKSQQSILNVKENNVDICGHLHSFLPSEGFDVSKETINTLDKGYKVSSTSSSSSTMNLEKKNKIEEKLKKHVDSSTEKKESLIKHCEEEISVRYLPLAH